MAEFHGTVELAAGITPKNGGSFALVGAHDVQIDDEGNRLDAEFFDLKSALGLPGIIVKDYIVDSGVWTARSGAMSLFIPVKGGEKAEMTATATSTGNNSVFTAIKNAVLPPVAGGAVEYSAEPGWGNPIVISANGTFRGVLPSDAKYVMVYLGLASSEYDRTPVMFTVDSYDYMADIFVNIRNCGAKISTATDKIDQVQTLKNMLKRQGYIANGVWKNSVASNRYVLYPVEPGDTVEVFGRSNNISYIGGLKASASRFEENAEFSDAGNWGDAIAIPKNGHWYGIIPDDVRYLYIFCGDDIYPRQPEKIYLNGYNIVDSIVGNISAKDSRTVDSYEYFGQNLNGVWDNIGNTKYAYFIVPVESDNKIVVVSNDKSGSQTYIGVLKTYSNPANGDTVDYSAAEGFGELITVPANSCKSFVVPADAKYIYVFEGITPNREKRPLLFAVDGFDVISGKNVFNDIPVNIRLMQYNIGKFAFGYSNDPSGSTSGLLSLIAYDVPGAVRKHQDYTYDEYVMHYRKMLCNYQPDIIGMEEYVNPINVMVTTDPDVYVEKSMADEVFDIPYPNVVYTANRQQAIRSKIQALGAKERIYTYVVNDETFTSSFTVAYFLYCGKLVCVGCNALNSESTDDGMAKRRAQLPAILDMFPDEDYVFLTFDVNNGGNWRTTPEGTPGYVSSPDDGEALLAIARSKGWNFAHGSYLPFEKTWFSPTGSGYDDWYMTIDNIIYKDNGKTVFSNVEKMPIDKAKELSSDHCPLIGDFLLF